jgi:hypothetical protein
VAELFRRWLFSSVSSIPTFSALPYVNEKGIQLTSVDQLPEENADFYRSYYCNHRLLNHGNLTGMVHFQCSVPWHTIKKPDDEYFKWLHLNKVFLNQTKFKTETLAPCEFLLGAHLGFFWRDEAEADLAPSINPGGEIVSFQLSARSVSVAISPHNKQNYTFQAVIVETSIPHAAKLREQFYSLHPEVQH